MNSTPKKNHPNDGMLTFLKGAKYLSLFIATLSGLRLASIMWQKSILQLFVEGWTEDLMSIYIGIISLVLLGGITYFTEGMKLEREAKNYNYLMFQVEEKERFRRMLNK